MDVRTINMAWESWTPSLKFWFSEVLGKTVKCYVDFDNQTYWGVRFAE